MKTTRQKLTEYIKKNMSKGYTSESLRWALINQRHSRVDVDKAIAQANKELAEQAPVVEKEKPKIKHELYDADNKLIKIKVHKPFFLKKFLKKFFYI